MWPFKTKKLEQRTDMDNPRDYMRDDLSRMLMQMRLRMHKKNPSIKYLSIAEELDEAKRRLAALVFTVQISDTCLIGKTDSKGVEIRNGDMVKGIGDHEGQSAVFEQEMANGGLEWQPFSYLNDYDGNNYEVVKN